MGMDAPLPHDIGPSLGLLCDRDIKAAVKRGYLFEEQTFREGNAKYASYEIRVGRSFEVLRFEGEDVVHIPRELTAEASIDIPPGATYLIIAEELFRVPADIFVRITTVGQIFASGLSAENTFADPGYTGPLYVTMNNLSNRILSLKRGDPLARVEFHRFQNKPDRLHAGFQGRRKSFVSAKLDTEVRELLRGKSAKELLQEMIAESLDEAIQSRFTRSEVLIEKAHTEIDSLRLAQGAIRRSQYITGAFVGIIVLFALNRLGLFANLDIAEVWKHTIEFVIAAAASIVAVLFDKKVLSKKK
jgi:deoxycytidine triphosphate deaminase